MAKVFWWQYLGVRPVWVEITQRPLKDVGSDLNHFNKRTWPLLAEAQRGDHVLHWYSKMGCFVGCSEISDSKVDIQGEDHFRYLTNFTQFPDTAISLPALRMNWTKIQKCHDDHSARVPKGSSLLFPFAPYAKTWKRLQPQLNYLTVAPPELTALLGSIYEAHRKGSKLYKSWSELGLGGTNVVVKIPKPVYQRVDELVTIAQGEVRIPDTAELEESTRMHRRLQNQAAVWLQKKGLAPFGAQPRDPLPVDIQWHRGSIHVVGEVKSLKLENETAQMRRGIGQVLHYRKLFEDLNTPGVTSVEAALIVSREPDKIWVRLCEDLRIRLAWPSQFGALTYRIEVDRRS
jgi:hypothetical protein